jgi:dienelactone hydrolase
MQKYDLDRYFSVRKYPMHGDLTIFILGAWGIRAITYTPLLNRLRKQGINSVLFLPSRKLIAVGVSYSEIVTSSIIVIAEIKKTIAEELQQNGSARFAALGISLGTALALKATKECPEITRVALVAAHGDFSQHVPLWHEKRLVNKMLRFDKIVDSQPTSITGSADMLNSINQTNNFQQLAGKDIYISYGNKDKIMHTAATEAFLAELKKANLSVTARVVRGGHHSTMAKGALLMQDFLPFLLKS